MAPADPTRRPNASPRKPRRAAQPVAAVAPVRPAVAQTPTRPPSRREALAGRRVPTPPAAKVSGPSPSRFATAPRLALASTLAVLLIVAVFATQVTSQPNTGTIKVHDGVDADPDMRNEPHVSGDVFIEGFNMFATGGDLLVYSWPPTGNMEFVLATTWTTDDGEPANHFLAGPFELPCGHYRVLAFNGDGPEDPEAFQPGGAKQKMFWVVGCGESEEPLPCPTDLQATALGNGNVQLTWTPAPGSDGSNLYRAVGDGGFEYVTTVGADVGTYLDETTAEGTSYAYLVAALFGNEESADCAIVEVTAIPEFPTVLGIGLASAGGLLAIGLAGRRRKA